MESELYWLRCRDTITALSLIEVGVEESKICAIPECDMLQADLTEIEVQHFIPKNTCYCYERDTITGKILYVCPFWDRIAQFPTQSNGHCHYLKRGDDAQGGLLWDMCKECGISEGYED